MTNVNIFSYWLEQGFPLPPAPGEQNPGVMGQQNQGEQPDPQDEPPKQNPADDEEENSLDDPQHPDMDGISDNEADFESWKKEYFDAAIKGDPNELYDLLSQVRDRDLTPPQRRFVEDNLQVVLLRRDANFAKASKEIRKLINQEMDRNNPSVSLMEHINNTLQNDPVLNSVFIKLAGQGALKADLHRRMIAALLGAVEVGGGGNKPDLIFPARDYSIDISTRFYTTWGDINIGRWMLEEDDPERILSDSELERLQDGSPEEKQVLRRRICLESIANKYANRAFIIHVVDPSDGTIHAMGWDMSDGLKTGYGEGKLIVRKRKSTVRNAIIDDNGSIIPVISYAILYKKETDQLTDSGTANAIEMAFMEQRDGLLYLTAAPETMQELSGGLPGITYTTQPWAGNPSDIQNIMRCFPSSVELLMRQC